MFFHGWKFSNNLPVKNEKGPDITVQKKYQCGNAQFQRDVKRC